jgi:tRNA pseudouridine32 synthase/23S rRNA pseudouridine746 synthase
MWNLDVLDVDDQLLVLNKPAGLPVMPDGWNPGAPYLLSLARAEFGRLWMVHRLDKVTSGVILFARSAEAHRALNSQFELHQASKIYHAIVNGRPAWNESTSNQRLRANVGHKHRTVIDSSLGKAAMTRFKVMERFPSAALLEASPVTGRTHQVRAHATGLGCPLLGDGLYGAPPTRLIDRPALHALSLTITPPGAEAFVTFTAAYPEDLESALARLRVQLR